MTGTTEHPMEDDRPLHLDPTSKDLAALADNPLVLHAPLAIIFMDETGHLFANHQAAKITGYTVDELLAMSFDQMAEMQHPDDRETVLSHIRSRLHSSAPTPTTFRHRILRKDGETRWIESHVRQFELDSRLTLHLMFNDITERTSVQQQLVQRSLQVDQIIRDSVDGIIIVNLNGAVLFANPAAGRILGTDQEALIDSDFGVPSSGLEMTQIRLLRDGEALTVEMRTADTIWQGEPAILISLRDVTALLGARQKAHERKIRFQALFENSLSPILIADPEGNYLDVNQAACDLFGYDREQFLQMNVADLKIIGNVTPAEMFKDYTQIRYQRGELTFIRKDGEVRTALYSASQISSNEHASVMTDVTDHRKAVQDLNERVKELRCLLEISQIAAQGVISPETVLKQAVKLLPPAWQFPDHCVACISWRGQSFEAGTFSQAVSSFSAPLLSRGKHAGQVEIGYTMEFPEADEGPFIKEERDLINAVAERLGHIIDRNHTSEALAEAHSIAYLGRWEMDLQDRTVDWSDSIHDLLEVDQVHPDQRIEVFFSRVHPDDREGLQERFRRIMHGQAEYEVSHRLLMPDGRVKWIRENGNTHFDEQGAPLRAVGTMQDITELKRTEDQLRQSRRLMMEAERLANLGAFQWDLQTGEWDVSDTWRSIHGLEAGKVVTRDDLLNLLHPEDRQRARELIDSLVERDEPIRFDTRIHRENDGVLRYVQTVAEVMRDSAGHATRVIGATIDITRAHQAEEERKSLEYQLRQSQKMESVGRLAGGVAHDFNNMLQTIIGNTEILSLDDHVNGQSAELLSEIRDAASRSAGLTRQLLAFARQQPISPKTLDLNETVSGMLRMLQRLIGEDIELSWSPGHDLWPVRIDPTQVDQILANLAVNARDAISGVGRINVRTCNSSVDPGDEILAAGVPEGDYVQLIVKDDGQGMDTRTIERVFEPFFTTKEQGQGTGLGLSTIYGIVKQNDGEILVDSKLGEGTSFHIFLPRQSELPEVVPKEQATEPSVTGDETILLVEDEDAIIRLGKRILSRKGYRVFTASTPAEARNHMSEHGDSIDLLITDVVMPEMNGRQLAEELKQLKPGLKTLFMSGYTADVIAQRGVLERGMNFIQKPFTASDLAGKVRAVLDAGRRSR